MTVLTWLILYDYLGAGSAALPNYIISVNSPAISTIVFIISITLDKVPDVSQPVNHIIMCFVVTSKIDFTVL